MKNWEINGHSDDVISIVNDVDYCEEFDVFDVHETNFTLSLKNKEGVLISVSYGINGTWHIGVSSLDEMKPLSEEWSLKLLPSNCGYKNALKITSPQGATLKKL